MSENEHTAKDVYSRVTSQIINAIEQGVSNWRMPWHTSGKFAFSPINVTSRKPYRGINTVCLWAAAQAKGYERGEWATYQQWQERGAQVRKGEKATLVVFWKFANETGDSQDGEEPASSRGSRLLFTRGYSVFNSAQVDGYTASSHLSSSCQGKGRPFFNRGRESSTVDSQGLPQRRPERSLAGGELPSKWTRCRARCLSSNGTRSESI